MWVVAFDSADCSSVSWAALAFPCASASLALWHEFLQSVFPLPPSPLAHLAVPEHILLIRSSLCWVSHWANCCFAQARYYLEQLLLFCLQPFLPHPWAIFMDSSVNSLLNSCELLDFLTRPLSNFGLVTRQEGGWGWSCPIGFAGFHFCRLQLEKGSSFPPIFQGFSSSLSLPSHIDVAWACFMSVLLCVSFSLVYMFHLVALFLLNMAPI